MFKRYRQTDTQKDTTHATMHSRMVRFYVRHELVTAKINT